MRHTRFVVAGRHPLLYLVRNCLIHAGYHLVEWGDDPAFCVWGGYKAPEHDFDIPVLHISSSNIYSCVEEPAEDSPLIVPSTMEPMAANQCRYILGETEMLLRAKRTMILRPFNVYGPNIKRGPVFNFLQAARRGETLNMFGSGYEVRAFLYEEDFLDCIKKVVKRLLKNGTGIFNVGSNEEISITRVADSVMQLTGKELPVFKSNPGYRIDDRKIANTTRIRAFVRWQPKITIRKGIWRLVHDNNEESYQLGEATC